MFYEVIYWIKIFVELEFFILLGLNGNGFIFYLIFVGVVK